MKDMSHEIIAVPNDKGFDNRPTGQGTRNFIAYMRRIEPDPKTKIIYQVLHAEKHWTVSSGDGGIEKYDMHDLVQALARWDDLPYNDECMTEYGWIVTCIKWLQLTKKPHLFVHFT